MSRTYPHPERHRLVSADEAREVGIGAMRGLLVGLTLFAIGALGIGLLWCAAHPDSAWHDVAAVVLVTAGVVLVAVLTFAPVAARQAGGKR